MASAEASTTTITPPEGSNKSTIKLVTYEDGSTATQISKVSESPKSSSQVGSSNPVATLNAALGTNLNNIFLHDKTSAAFLRDIYENPVDLDEIDLLYEMMIDHSFFGKNDILKGNTFKKGRESLTDKLLKGKEPMDNQKKLSNILIGENVVSPIKDKMLNQTPKPAEKDQHGIGKVMTAIKEDIEEEPEPEPKKILGMPKKTAIIVGIVLFIIILALVYFLFIRKK